MQATAIDLTELAPKACDDEDVNWALSTATALLDRGDRAEAIKWLRRAAGAAADEGQDLRAIALYKLAAEVANEADAAAAVPVTPPVAAASGERARRFLPRASPIPPPPRRSSPAPRPSAPEPIAHSLAGVSAVAPGIPNRVADEDAPTAPSGLPDQRRYDDLEEVTAVMQNEADTEPDLPRAAQVPSARPSTRPSSPPRKPVRVAIVSGAGGKPTLRALDAHQRPPRGAALATLTPTSARDAELIEALLAG